MCNSCQTIFSTKQCHICEKSVLSYEFGDNKWWPIRWFCMERDLTCVRTNSMWIISFLKNKRPTWCHLLYYFTSYVLNMFWTLIYPSSGACNYSIELPHWLYCSWFDVCWSFGVVGLEWSEACNTDTTQTQLYQISNTQRSENKTADVVIQQQSCKLLMMDILMSETCWVHKKWNKIASGIKLVFYSSTITMMHGPINIRLICFVYSM